MRRLQCLDLEEEYAICAGALSANRRHSQRLKRAGRRQQSAQVLASRDHDHHLLSVRGRAIAVTDKAKKAKSIGRK